MELQGFLSTEARYIRHWESDDDDDDMAKIIEEVLAVSDPYSGSAVHG